jgi:hypothetical protein
MGAIGSCAVDVPDLEQEIRLRAAQHLAKLGP